MSPRVWLAVTVITLTLAASTALAAVAAWSPGPAAQTALARGGVFIEVVGEPDNRHGVIRAAIDIAAPRERVWRVMTDCARSGTLIHNSTCRIVSGNMLAGSDVREQVMAGNIVFPSMHNVVRTDYTPFSSMRFRRTAGDFQTLEGEWRLESINNGAGTRVIYVNRLAVNLRIPAALMREGMRRDVPRMLQNLRRESLSGR